MKKAAGGVSGGTISASSGVLRPWIPPSPGEFKMNVDAACFDDINGGGVGALIRDCKGNVMLVISLFIEPLVEVAAMEALAILHACVVAGEERFTDLIVETDSEVVAKGFTSGSHEFSSFGHILDAIRSLAPVVCSSRIRFTPRSGNGMAHNLARYAKIHRSHYISSEFFPPCIHSLMCTEVFSDD